MLYVSIFNGLKMEKKSSVGGHYTLNPGDPNIASIIKTEYDIHSSGTAVKVGHRPSHSLNNIGSLEQSKMLVLGKLILDANDLPINYAEDIFIVVSANGDMRDNIRRAVRGYLSKGFKLKELDYQPR